MQPLLNMVRHRHRFYVSFTHLVPVNIPQFLEIRGRVGLITEIMEQVRSPLICRDGIAIKGLDVISHVWQEVIESADGTLEMKEEVGAQQQVSRGLDPRKRFTFSYGTWLYASSATMRVSRPVAWRFNKDFTHGPRAPCTRPRASGIAGYPS